MASILSISPQNVTHRLSASSRVPRAPAIRGYTRKFGDNVRSRREAQDLSSSSTLSLSNGQEQLAERALSYRLRVSLGPPINSASSRSYSFNPFSISICTLR
jgi:hypothetical protein